MGWPHNRERSAKGLVAIAKELDGFRRTLVAKDIFSTTMEVLQALLRRLQELRVLGQLHELCPVGVVHPRVLDVLRVARVGGLQDGNLEVRHLGGDLAHSGERRQREPSTLRIHELLVKQTENLHKRRSFTTHVHNATEEAQTIWLLGQTRAT